VGLRFWLGKDAVLCFGFWIPHFSMGGAVVVQPFLITVKM
jgi:hypothetical protein